MLTLIVYKMQDIEDMPSGVQCRFGAEITYVHGLSKHSDIWPLLPGYMLTVSAMQHRYFQSVFWMQGFVLLIGDAKCKYILNK